MTTTTAHKVSITDAGPSRKRVSISIPADVVSARLRQGVDSIVADAQLPGFRRGRAPRHLVEKKFGSALRDDAKRALVAEAVQSAVQEHKLKVVGDATAELENVEVREGHDLSFDVDVEVMPEFDLPKLEGLDIMKPTFEIPDSMIDDEVKKFQINEGRLETREVPEPGDYLTGHGIMKGADGTEFYNIKGAVVQVPPADKGGKGMILGVMVEDFSKQIGLPKAGETVKINATGPESHEVEAVRGAKLTITFQVERCDRIIPADLGEIISRYGFTDEAALKEAIRSRLEQRGLIQQTAAMRQQVARYLLDNTTMELPERLSAQQAARTLQRQRLELMYRGHEATQIEEHMAELRANSAALAQGELKLFFILSKAGDQLHIQVNEAEMNGRIAQIAAERNIRPEMLRQELINRNQVGGIFQQLREHKTFDAILSKANVKEVSADEFNAKMAEQNKSDSEAKGKADSDDGDSKSESKPKSKSKKKSE
jgi:trigger factor